MADTLHDIVALSHHMNNEDSFLWITGQIQQSNFELWNPFNPIQMRKMREYIHRIIPTPNICGQSIQTVSK